MKMLYSGLDHLSTCLDRNHFNNYPYPVSYLYNSRGFRDSEWPENLSESIWCVGDSFTSGIGQPYEHIWPQVLENKLKVRTINVSMDGGSNPWMTRKIVKIAKVVKPKTIIVQWSYAHRREKEMLPGESLDDSARKIWVNNDYNPIEDIANLMACIKQCIDACKQSNTTLINSFIPHFTPKEDIAYFWNEFKTLNALHVDYTACDKARDGHHYDIKTSTIFVDNLIESKYINI
jgi:hypothetical protein